MKKICTTEAELKKVLLIKKLEIWLGRAVKEHSASCGLNVFCAALFLEDQYLKIISKTYYQL